MNPRTTSLLFLGASGAGKDTQADILVEKYGYEKISSGDVVREYMNTATDVDPHIRELYNQGEFLEDDDLYALLARAFQQRKLHDKVILVGFVRRPSQIPLLELLLRGVGRTLDKVVVFEVSDKTAAERMLHRHRQDDHPHAIAHRLYNYLKTVREIADHYHTQGVLLRVNGDQEVQAVNDELRSKLGSLL